MSTGPTSIHTQPSLLHPLLHFRHVTLQLPDRPINPLQALQMTTQNLRDLSIMGRREVGLGWVKIL